MRGHPLFSIGIIGGGWPDEFFSQLWDCDRHSKRGPARTAFGLVRPRPMRCASGDLAVRIYDVFRIAAAFLAQPAGAPLGALSGPASFPSCSTGWQLHGCSRLPPVHCAGIALPDPSITASARLPRAHGSSHPHDAMGYTLHQRGKHGGSPADAALLFVCLRPAPFWRGGIG